MFHNKNMLGEKWTKEKVIKTAMNYRNISEFVKKEPSAYRWGVRFGLKDIISKNYKQK